MKIFAISDIHGEKKYFDAGAGLIQSADLVIVAGDLTNRGDRKSAGDILSRIEGYTDRIVAVHGNWDPDPVADLLRERGYSLHGRGRIIGGTGFFGVGGSNKTPMHMPSEYTDDELWKFLEAGYGEVRSAEKIVLISHAPPRKVRDKTFFGIHAGSSSISEFIQRNRVDLCITGHIHEAFGEEYLNGCIVVNSGSFRKGRYSTIDMGVSITVELGRLQS